MKLKKLPSLSVLSLVVLAFTACNNQPAKQQEPKGISVHTETVKYKVDTVSLDGYVAYGDSSTHKRPGVLVIPEWWGVTDYVKMRAAELAKLGYIAFVVDMYGNGTVADNPEDAGKLAGAFYADPQLTKARFDAALAKLKTFEQTDTTNIAAIGFCFGGNVAINVAKMGAHLNGVVSFHGGLEGVPANKDLLTAKILVCHGDSDVMVNGQVDAFKKQMDSIGADYKFIHYPNATHAFTNPGATEKGKKFNMPIAYNKEADSASWKDMQQFFDRIFTHNTHDTHDSHDGHQH